MTCFHPDANLLKRAIRSAAFQSLPSDFYEIVLVDDGSGPSFASVFEEAVSEFLQTARIRTVSHPENLGVTAARRTGANAARGNYVTFLDFDDQLDRYALEHMLAASQGLPKGFLVRGVVSIYEGQAALPARHSKLNQVGDVTLLGFIEMLTDQFAHRSFAHHGVLIPTGIAQRAFSLISDSLDPSHPAEDLISCGFMFLCSSGVANIANSTYHYHKRDFSRSSTSVIRELEGYLSAFPHWLDSYSELIAENKQVAKSIALAITRFVGDSVQKISASDFSRSEIERISSSSVRALLVASLELGNGQITASIKSIESQLAKLAKNAGAVKGQIPPGASAMPIPTTESLLMEGRFVFVATTDYHVDHFYSWIEGSDNLQLDKLTLIDGSGAASAGMRRWEGIHNLIPSLEVFSFEVGVLAPETLLLAKTVFVYNDRAAFCSMAIQARYVSNLPVVAIIEGITDPNGYLGGWSPSSPGSRKIGYRACDFILMPGSIYSDFFKDRKTQVLGMPLLASWTALQNAASASDKSVLVNLNFSYGVQAEFTLEFLRGCQEAIESLGAKMVISVHPRHDWVPVEFSCFVSHDPIESLLLRSRCLISRYSTVILRGVASGLPVIYFNPMEDDLAKFFPLDPMVIPQPSTPEDLREELRKILETKKVSTSRSKELLNQYADSRLLVDLFGPGSELMTSLHDIELRHQSVSKELRGNYLKSSRLSPGSLSGQAQVESQLILEAERLFDTKLPLMVRKLIIRVLKKVLR